MPFETICLIFLNLILHWLSSSIEIIERPRMIHAEHALKTLESKSLLYKSYSEEGNKTVI